MKAISLLFFLIPFISFSQKIEKDEIDTLTHKRRIVTTETGLKNGVSQYLGAWYRTVDTTVVIALVGNGVAVGNISATDIAILTTVDDKDITIQPVAAQNCIGKGFSNAYEHQYYISKEDVITLSTHKLQNVRRYTASGTTDIPIPDKKQDALMKLSKLLLKELDTPPQKH